MPAAVYCNNTDLAGLGLYVNVPDRFTAPGVSFPSVAVAGRLAPLASTPPLWGESTVLVRGMLRPAAGTVAALASALLDLTDLAYQGQITLKVDNGGGTVRELVGVTVAFNPVLRGDFLTATAATIEWTIRKLEGSWRSASPEIIPLAAGIAAAIPCGTAPSGWIATITGQPSNPFTLIFKKASGEAITTMSFAVALTGVQYLIVDGGAMTVQKVDTGGVPTDAITVLTGNFPPRGINPEDAFRAGASYPTVTLSTGSGDLYTLPRWIGS